MIAGLKISKRFCINWPYWGAAKLVSNIKVFSSSLSSGSTFEIFAPGNPGLDQPVVLRAGMPAERATFPDCSLSNRSFADTCGQGPVSAECHVRGPLQAIRVGSC